MFLTILAVPPHPGRMSQIDLGRADLRGLLCVNEITCQGQLQSAGKAMTIDLADDDLFATDNGVLNIETNVGEPVE